MEKTEYIWLDGEFVKWDSAKVHILTHTLHYGLGVFEGIRVYKCSENLSSVFCLDWHVKRFFESAKIVGLKIPFKPSDIEKAILETVKKNGVRSGYIRPIAIIGDGEMGLYAYDNPVHVAIAVWPWGTYLGEEGLKKGIRVKISSFVRHHINASMTKAKVCGYYVNSILAKKEAKELGFDEAVLLDSDGFVAEGAGENIFIVKDGVVKTPAPHSILPGITRKVVMLFLKEFGIDCKEERFTRDELYTSDEAFLTGTAAEITPIREVDGRAIGNGEFKIVRKIQDKFFKVTTGKDEKYMHLLSFVDFSK
ncbi:MAG: branched-chain amino acid transaminase [Candidatus Calescibacterium sp.]|nr:branched-chain amino acid transaminase [Candidatus Calescibacterium sp.]MCX7734488.1 branched-chain amino acid transaminase [bacterium]MDW8087318.1 branched-chain amino acid transaminase [Candidatus Calescibacterium sp.]